MTTYREASPKPTPPAEILRQEFFKVLGISEKVLAEHLGCDVKAVNRIATGACR